MEVKKPFILSAMKLPLLDSNSKVRQRAAVVSAAQLASEATTAQAAAPGARPKCPGTCRSRDLPGLSPDTVPQV